VFLKSRHGRAGTRGHKGSLKIWALADDLVETGIKAKVENRGQYDQYLEELKPLREELGVNLKEDLYPDEAK
jgi:hypothetical protein